MAGLAVMGTKQNFFPRVEYMRPVGPPEWQCPKVNPKSCRQTDFCEFWKKYTGINHRWRGGPGSGGSLASSSKPSGYGNFHIICSIWEYTKRLKVFQDIWLNTLPKISLKWHKKYEKSE